MSALFWGLAAVLIAGVLALMLPPLRRGARGGPARGALNLALYHDRETELAAELRDGTLAPELFEAARNELKRELLDSLGEEGDQPASPAPPWGLWGVGLGLPLVAVLFYLGLGNPGLLQGPPDHARMASEADGGDMEQLVEKLAQRLRDRPDDAEGWALLGRSLSIMERHGEAAQAFERARQLAGDTAELLIEEAQELALSRSGQLAGAPMERVRRALELAPGHPDALWFTGLDALQRGQQQEAVTLWGQLLAGMPEGVEGRATVEDAIAQARGQMGAAKPAPGSDAIIAPKITVRVTLDPALAAQVGPDDTVFVLARTPGGRMPIAAVRLRAGELPATVVLDNGSRLGEVSLAASREVTVVARISKSGNAAASPGDLEGEVHAHVGGEVTVTIERAVP